MLSKMISSRFFVILALTIGWIGPKLEAASACVWKVSDPNGRTLYLGGSIHALRGTDYPLPAAYNRAFDASTRLVFEVDPKEVSASSAYFSKTAEYSKGDSLKNHVDPRTYDYVRRVFKLMGVPEEKFSRYRPWALEMFLQSPGLHGLSSNLGVEGFMLRRAQVNSKPVSGLESTRESMEITSGLTDRQSEALLLITFIPHAGGKETFSRMLDAWRHGDTETLARLAQEEFSDFPAMSERILDERNRKWIPKIEDYLRSGQTYFVIAGAAHMGGPEGVLALLKSRGYKIEQL
jgi:uncharacterized protein YbaP (TraB family)